MGPKPLSKPPLGQPYTKKREVGVNSTQRALPSLSLPQRLGTGLPTDLTEGSSGPSLWRHVTAGQSAVDSSCLWKPGKEAAREGGHRAGKHLSQGQGAATGDLAIAALDPTHLASKRTLQTAQNSGTRPQALARTPFPLRMRPRPSLRTRSPRRGSSE